MAIQQIPMGGYYSQDYRDGADYADVIWPDSPTLVEIEANKHEQPLEFMHGFLDSYTRIQANHLDM